MGFVAQYRNVGGIPGHLLDKGIFRFLQPFGGGIPQFRKGVIGKFPDHHPVGVDAARDRPNSTLSARRVYIRQPLGISIS